MNIKLGTVHNKCIVSRIKQHQILAQPDFLSACPSSGHHVYNLLHLYKSYVATVYQRKSCYCSLQLWVRVNVRGISLLPSGEMIHISVTRIICFTTLHSHLLLCLVCHFEIPQLCFLLTHLIQ